jgi:phospholipid/cholesterol/gamma-HCH transport system substrate-binding protein
MAQRKQLSWTELRVGVFVLAGLAVMALGIFYVTGGATFSPKYRLFTYMPEVEGLQVGAPVTVSGLTVGAVETIVFNPSPEDPAHNVKIVLRINKKFEENIRTDSAATLVTVGLLGDRYVSISRGVKGPELQAGATVPSTQAKAIEQMVERGVELEDKLGALTDQINAIVTDVHSGSGTVGKLLYDQALYNHLNATAANLDHMSGVTAEGRNSVGKLFTSDELYTKLDATMGHAQNILGAVEDQKGSLGKLIYDPAVHDQLNQFLNHGNSLLADAQAGKGTLGKFITDDSLFVNLRDASANVRDASAKLNTGEGTFGKFFTNPQLYDNLTGLTGDMRGLVSDFRTNPKKFLHVRVTIF